MKSVFLFTALLTACGATPVASSGPPRVTIPVAPSASVADPGPPPSLASKEALFPKVARRVLPNGLEVAVVEAHALPIVQVRLFVRAGMGYGGPALASLTAQLLKDGGTRSMKNTELVERIERLGATLSVQTGLDSTVLGLGITKEHLSEAIAILAEMVRSPRFEETELDKLKARATDEAEDSARSDGSWTATRVLFHELYQSTSPYAVYDASPADIRKVTGKTVRTFHRRFYVPKNTTLVVAGDTTLDLAADVAVHSFGTWAGGNAPVREAVPLVASKGRRVVIAHRPQSAQSDVFAVGTVPQRDTPDWPAIRVATQVLGGGPASRLFMDVREKRSLAYQTRASLIELAQGPQPVVAYAGTRTAKTAEALDGLLENLERMVTAAPSEDELATARRYLVDVFAIRMETVGAIADMVVTESTLGLGDGYWDRYRAKLRTVDAKAVGEVSRAMFRPTLIVVAGDADVIGTSLTRFGVVTVVDPEHEFRLVRTLPAAAAAR